MTRRGFTLVELMLSASILAMGMVLVARGLLTASSALQTVDNRVAAYMFLDEKLQELQQRAIEEGGLGPTQDAGSTEFSNGRSVSWTLDIQPITLTVSGLPTDPAAGQAEDAVPGEEGCGDGGPPGSVEPGVDVRNAHRPEFRFGVAEVVAGAAIDLEDAKGPRFEDIDFAGGFVEQPAKAAGEGFGLLQLRRVVEVGDEPHTLAVLACFAFQQNSTSSW